MDLRQLVLSYKTALLKLESFAIRNEKRAQQAVEATKRDWAQNPGGGGAANVMIMEARHHEAQRFLQVVKLQVAEVLHATKDE